MSLHLIHSSRRQRLSGGMDLTCGRKTQIPESSLRCRRLLLHGGHTLTVQSIRVADTGDM